MNIAGRLPILGLALAIVGGGALMRQGVVLPADAAGAVARLTASPRHGEYKWVKVSATDSVHLWVVYPERKDKAPVVVVVQEIYGMSDWLRAVGDQLAAEGYIAVVPDLVSGKGPNGSGTEGMTQQQTTAATSQLSRAEWSSRLAAATAWAVSQPSADGRYAAIGFCWGGGTVFNWAAMDPKMVAAVVNYGTAPDTASMKNIRAQVLGNYGGNDARISATVPTTDSAMKRFGKKYEPHIYEGAGHGFFRAQDGANGRAVQEAWPRTIAFLKAAFAR